MNAFRAEVVTLSGYEYTKIELGEDSMRVPVVITRERLADLLIDPREDLDFEIKNWLDLRNSNDDKATFAKAALAITNHGGGYIVLGLAESESGVIEADGRPATLDGYSQDRINGIIQSYCDPPFHCAVHMVANAEGALFPIIVVPGGNRVPVRAKRGGPNGNTVANNAIYVRKAGPRSETPQTSQDWEDLLARCFQNRRDEMFDQIRALITGAVPQVAPRAEPPRIEAWAGASRARWEELIQQLPEGAGPRLVHGRYSFVYEIIGEHRAVASGSFPEVLQASAVRHTGWPPFWFPTRQGIRPYNFDGAVECWIGGDTEERLVDRDPGHSDFWRIHPDGLAYLMRGYQEDGMDVQEDGRRVIAPRTVFDLSLPVWRVGEALLHARSLANNLFVGSTTIRFIATYEGLSGRTLDSLNRMRNVREGRVARQDVITLETHVSSESIEANLPEIVHPLMAPLYALFDFFELPMSLVTDELGRMRGNQF